ncbi:hypothetical protein M407DRAFT_22354 [Tulasnella calospora MUT 4182]|uniref:Uncharacterized protein n=1 Tax=Tulasnella calospora MUT 4182 TaxID=1051891 RepID=A0A0C3QN73_9AGAM|nr:hypothetical protein M407DRAFT_22354 [Tulasnella calospora MUT 4182]
MVWCAACNKEFKTKGNHRFKCAAYKNSVKAAQKHLNIAAGRSDHGVRSSSGAEPSSIDHPVATAASSSAHDTGTVQVDTGTETETAIMEADLSDSEPRAAWRIFPRGQPRPFNDAIPEIPSASDDEVVETSEDPSNTRLPRIFRSALNAFGIYRTYSTQPVSNQSTPPAPPPLPDKPLPRLKHHVLWPYPNFSSFLFGRWFWSGEKKSQEDRAHLLDVLLHPDFKLDDIRGVGFNSIDKKLSDLDANSSEIPFLPDGWSKSDISITVPLPKSPPQSFSIPSLHHRNLMAVIRDTFSHDPAARNFCYQPYREYCKWPENYLSTNEVDERLYGELYSSDAFNAEHEKLQTIPTQDSYPKAIAALMFWSDSTHLAQFGQAKLWPLYLYFGNQSKYERSRPTSNAAHHVAYLPSLPDTVKDTIAQHEGLSKSAQAPLLAHCRRELMHNAWKVILDQEFLAAYKHGTVVKCADGVHRRLFPRIFTYSADYPEKVLLVTIRDLGSCPCPRCLVKKEDIPALGTPADTETREAYRREDNAYWRAKVQRAAQHVLDGKGITSQAVKNLLDSESLVPTVNAFSAALHPLSVDFFQFFVPDILHEFDLGVWKAFFTHLVRILGSSSTYRDGLAEVDKRYRDVNPFGSDTIRKFHSNASEMKKLAARDFEDLLLVSLPVFDGLFGEPYDEIVQDCLFALCYWHALAKLRLHTERTLRLLEVATFELGQQLRRFVADVCEHMTTYETVKERNTRRRRKAKAQDPPNDERKVKTFNMFTYKMHSLGDYVAAIRLFGTTESWSTQVGELEHRRVKSFWRRSNQREATSQIAAVETRGRFHERIWNRIQQAQPQKDATAALDEDTSDAYHGEVGGRSHEHHYIGIEGTKLQLSSWLETNRNDPSTKFFQRQLLDHILARFRGNHYEGREVPFTDLDRSSVAIRHNRLYKHPILRVNYTTYDLRREQDIINLTTKRDIMLLADEDPAEDLVPHPYWYARVQGIFHAEVMDRTDRNSRWQRIEFLWVRWFGRCPDYEAGWKARRLDRIGYVPTDADAFGFIDPAWVTHQSWETGNSIIFCDRDMFMRYLGLGPGHAYLFQANPFNIDVQASLERSKEECNIYQIPAHLSGVEEEDDVSVGSNPSVDPYAVESSDEGGSAPDFGA